MPTPSTTTSTTPTTTTTPTPTTTQTQSKTFSRRNNLAPNTIKFRDEQDPQTPPCNSANTDTTPTASLTRRKHLTPNKNRADYKLCTSTRKDVKSKGSKKRMNSAISSTDANSLINGNRKGAKLFTALDCYNLEGNPRAEKDKEHAAYIAKLHKGTKVDAAELLQRYKMLTSKDLDNDTQWRFATVIVPNNRERIDIVAKSIIDFAIYTDQPVVRWLCSIKSWDGAPEDLTLRTKAMQDPVFWQYFVKWADSICNDNKSVKINVTNGDRCD